MVPVVELRRAEQPAQGAEREAHVGVDEDRPHAAERGDAGEPPERHAEEERGEVLRELREDPVDGVLAVRGEEVQVLGAVVHGVEPPQRLPRVARAVEPVDEHVAEDDGEHAPRGRRERPRGDRMHAEARHLALHEREERHRGGAPDEVLAREEHGVDAEPRAQHALPAPRRKEVLERHEDDDEDEQARPHHGEALEHQGAPLPGACCCGTACGACEGGGSLG